MTRVVPYPSRCLVERTLSETGNGLVPCHLCCWCAILVDMTAEQLAAEYHLNMAHAHYELASLKSESVKKDNHNKNLQRQLLNWRLSLFVGLVAAISALAASINDTPPTDETIPLSVSQS